MEERSNSNKFRSSRLKIIFKIGVFKNFANFTGKRLFWNLFSSSIFCISTQISNRRFQENSYFSLKTNTPLCYNCITRGTKSLLTSSKTSSVISPKKSLKVPKVYNLWSISNNYEWMKCYLRFLSKRSATCPIWSFMGLIWYELYCLGIRIQKTKKHYCLFRSRTNHEWRWNLNLDHHVYENICKIKIFFNYVRITIIICLFGI